SGSNPGGPTPVGSSAGGHQNGRPIHSMTHHLDTIVQLQQALNELDEAVERLHGIPDWMRELHHEHVASRAEIETLEQGAETAAHDRRAAESAIEDAQEKLKKFQQQIN